MVPGHSCAHQTASGIWEIGSLAQVPFAILLCCGAASHNRLTPRRSGGIIQLPGVE